jgi:hypothetical protein
MLIDDFNNAIDVWINTVEQYSFEELCRQPDEHIWSLGQICVHLINDTSWFVEQIKICLLNDENANESMTSFAQTIFQNNSFPDEKLTNPANDNMLQPSGKEKLLEAFIQLKKDMNEVAAQIQDTASKGKTKHPGFGYFNAMEWLQFAEMHLRHHLKQKERIEKFLQRS